MPIRLFFLSLSFSHDTSTQKEEKKVFARPLGSFLSQQAPKRKKHISILVLFLFLRQIENRC
jgi:hypothetical protein